MARIAPGFAGEDMARLWHDPGEMQNHEAGKLTAHPVCQQQAECPIYREAAAVRTGTSCALLLGMCLSAWSGWWSQGESNP